jgi:hypothetical protein
MAQPTIQQLIDSIIDDFETTMGVTIPDNEKNDLKVRSTVQAGRLKLLYLNQAKIQKNIWPDTAEYESQGGTLQRFGRIKLNRSPFPAVSGQYDVSVTGTNGQIIPSQSTFNTDDSSSAPGFRFILDNDYTVGDPSDMIIRALTPGLDSGLIVGDTLTTEFPIPLVDSTITVTLENIQAQQAEDLEEYREKTLEAFVLSPQGGSPSDYRIWSGEAQGVNQSYPFTAQVGTQIQVNLYIEATIADSTDGKGTPSTTILDAVEEAIEQPTSTRPSRKPATDLVNYIAVTPLDVEITIPNFIGLTLTSTALIDSAIQDLVNSIRPFVDSIDVLSEKNNTLSTNNIAAAILTAVPGSQFGTVVLEVAATPYTSYEFDLGEIPYLASVTHT